MAIVWFATRIIMSTRGFALLVVQSLVPLRHIMMLLLVVFTVVPEIPLIAAASPVWTVSPIMGNARKRGVYAVGPITLDIPILIFRIA
jgi:hypothetical protein